MSSKFRLLAAVSLRTSREITKRLPAVLWATALATLLGGASVAESAVVFAEQLAQSSALGRTMASLDMGRQLQIDIPGIGKLEGTSTPLGPKFTGFNWHYIDDIFDAGYTFTGDDIAAGNPNKQFNINISVGPSRSENLWTSRVGRIETYADRDFVLAETTDAKPGARPPTFADANDSTAYTFAAFDNYAVFYNATQYNDQNANGWMMGSTSNQTSNVSLSSSTLSSSPLIRGGGLALSSSSPGYEGNLTNPTGAEPLVMIIQTMSPNIESGRAGNGAIPFTTSGLADLINDRTYAINSQYVPEPTTATLLLGGAGRACWRSAGGGTSSRGTRAFLQFHCASRT